MMLCVSLMPVGQEVIWVEPRFAVEKRQFQYENRCCGVKTDEFEAKSDEFVVKSDGFEVKTMNLK